MEALILLATIEHSGTHQMIRIIGRPVCPLEEADRSKPGMVLFAHLYDKMMPMIEDAAQRMPVVTTARSVRDICKSWISRGLDLAELDVQLRNYKRLLEWKPYIVSLGRKWP